MAGVAHPEARGDVAAIGGAVDDGVGHLRVVEHRRDVVDGLLDGQRLGRQVGTGVVVTRHPHPAVFDHDHVQALHRRPPAQAAVQRDRGSARPAGDDDQRMFGLSSGAHVVQVEFGCSLWRHRTPHRPNPGQRGELLVHSTTLFVQRHRCGPAMV
jgi:hypothetical protein